MTLASHIKTAHPRSKTARWNPGQGRAWPGECLIRRRWDVLRAGM